jgi:hypothetical protein
MRGSTLLLEVARLFSTRQKAHAYFGVLRRAGSSIPCPECGCPEHYYLETPRVWKCKPSIRKFSVTAGTILEDSPRGLYRRRGALWLISDAKNRVSACALALGADVRANAAGFMNHRIRLGMWSGNLEKLELRR